MQEVRGNKNSASFVAHRIAQHAAIIEREITAIHAYLCEPASIDKDELYAKMSRGLYSLLQHHFFRRIKRELENGSLAPSPPTLDEKDPEFLQMASRFFPLELSLYKRILYNGVEEATAPATPTLVGTRNK